MPVQIGPKKKIAFVCSGGATKAGAFHLGVALALQEQGFKFYGGLGSDSSHLPGHPRSRPPGPMEISTYVGSSAGAIISTYLAAGYSLDNIFSSFLGKNSSEHDLAGLFPKPLPRLTYQKMFKLRSTFEKNQISQLTRLRKTISELVEGNWESLVQFKWLKATGIFSTSGLEQYMREEVLLSNRFQDYAADLFIVATQLNHSRKVIFGKQSYQPPPHDLTCQYNNDIGISDACAASTALPIIFSPHPIRGENGEVTHFIDGEIRDTLSTHVAVDSGADLVIASYTHQPYHGVNGLESLTDHGLPAIAIQSIYLLIEQKIKNHIHNKEIQRNAIQTVSDYCKTEGISEHHRHQICGLLEKQLHHRMDVETIYIHPKPTDKQLFLGEHFSFAPKKMAETVKSGFRAAIETLRKYDFADRQKRRQICE